MVKTITWEELMEKHGDEIKLYEATGKLSGRLLFSMAILSDVEEMFPKTRDELEEVKLLLSSVIKKIKEKRLEEVL